ncbi:MAG: 4-(cytidine 5'-diphospho)-2-C-methyl-D-erythritol kinase [Parvibaculaceae bacterium]
MSHTELAPAKVNLALHVLGRRDDGYHELDSIVAFAGVADRLSFVEAEDWRLYIAGPFARALPLGDDNLVLKAAHAFDEAWPGQGKYRITLEKNLPVASGIGGGSADAAAVLRALAKLAGMAETDKLAKVAAAIGADVPVCLAGKTCRMRGIGEEIDILEGVPQMPAVLVNPGTALATADVFAKLAFASGHKGFSALALDADWASLRNDLTMPALTLAPQIGKVLAALRAQADLRYARMSGSGATCFGIFGSPEAAEAAARNIAKMHSEWWAVATPIG